MGRGPPHEPMWTAGCEPATEKFNKIYKGKSYIMRLITWSIISFLATLSPNLCLYPVICEKELHQYLTRKERNGKREEKREEGRKIEERRGSERNTEKRRKKKRNEDGEHVNKRMD
uniref:Uncharacterized protein n=1 Tax=Pristionchus pacificus TaxID=54126 RepID=A0A2A6CRS1_PRIPA|eukprot:PDM80798.1 hypothetical protein PRIPAC_35801 [Pristionchus pacificus]